MFGQISDRRIGDAGPGVRDVFSSGIPTSTPCSAKYLIRSLNSFMTSLVMLAPDFMLSYRSS